MDWDDREESKNVEVQMFGINWAESERRDSLLSEITAYQRGFNDDEFTRGLFADAMYEIVTGNKGKNRFIYDLDDAEVAFDTIRKEIKEGNDSPKRIMEAAQKAVSSNRTLPKAVLRTAQDAGNAVLEGVDEVLDPDSRMNRGIDKVMSIVSLPYWIGKRIVGKK